MNSSKPQTLTGKIAIVTGASRGIGAGIAMDLAQRGAKVAITYTSPSSTPQATSLVETIHALPNHSSPSPSIDKNPPAPAALSIRTDLRDPSAASHIVTKTLEAFRTSHIDILVNNAAISVPSPIQSITPEIYAETFDLNVRAPVLLVRAVAPYLRRGRATEGSPEGSTQESPREGEGEGTGGTGGGRIITVGSVGSRCGFRDMSLYCASKAAVEGLTRCWAADLGGLGVTVNAVNPGPVRTEMIEGIEGGLVADQIRGTPVDGGRIGEVRDVVPLVGWLAGEESRWVTGQVVSVSGGWAMY